MKTYRNIFNIMILCSLAIFASCNDDDSSTPSETERFEGTWTVNSVTLNSVDVLNPEYTNFRITFNSDGSYITIDGDPVFTDTGGFWSVNSSTESTASITMDGVAVLATFGVDNSTLTLSFTANDQVVGARTLGLVGDYVFVLTKQ